MAFVLSVDKSTTATATAIANTAVHNSCAALTIAVAAALGTIRNSKFLHQPLCFVQLLLMPLMVLKFLAWLQLRYQYLTSLLLLVVIKVVAPWMLLIRESQRMLPRPLEPLAFIGAANSMLLTSPIVPGLAICVLMLWLFMPLEFQHGAHSFHIQHCSWYDYCRFLWMPIIAWSCLWTLLAATRMVHDATCKSSYCLSPCPICSTRFIRPQRLNSLVFLVS